MKRIVLLSALALLCCILQGQAAASQTKRALLIGINHYKPEEAGQSPSAPSGGVEVTASAQRTVPKGRGTWINLDGCINDVEVVRDLLVGRFGFVPGNVTLLCDSQATRGEILTAIRTAFIDSAAAGDELFFMYAGHGSQVVNSKSSEPDKKDETIVPADAFKGTPDIRDKEIKKIFNEVLDKGVVLTMVFDCCHSGSIARGMPQPGTTRFLEADPRDIADPETAGPGPEERGALVLSAAQDMQLAAEASDENDLPHGAFSLALIKVLRTVDVRESVDQLFARVKAIMQSEGRTQEPVLAGPADRRRKPLIGGGAGLATGALRVPVLRADDKGCVTLLGGLALGLAPGCELKKSGTISGDARVRLSVTSVSALNKCEAKIIEGSVARVAPGDVFEVDRWASSPASGLRVWMAPNPPADAELTKLASIVAGMAGNAALVEDPTEVSPGSILAWDGKGWVLSSQNAKSLALGRTPSAKAIGGFVRENGGSLFVNYPPTVWLRQDLEKTIGTPSSTVRSATKPGDAHYLLVGRRTGNEFSFAWVLPNVSRKDSGSFPLPIRTDWTATGASRQDTRRAAKQLADFAQRIEKIRGWLLIDSPPDEGRFPYQLALRNSRTGEIRVKGAIFERESYGLVLRADSARLARPVDIRYVYVFALDSFGNCTLLFPRAGTGNIENRVPYESSSATPVEIALGRPVLFSVGPPYGLDTYVLLTSEQAIPDPDGLAFEGVRTRGDLSTSPLANLLMSIGGSTRGPQPIIPADWSLHRMFIRSSPAAQ
jgi:hypothetical protein